MDNISDMRTAKQSGKPRQVYLMTPHQEEAIEDYYFKKDEIRNLRELSKILNCSVQGASNISLRVLAQWAQEGKIKVVDNMRYKKFANMVPK